MKTAEEVIREIDDLMDEGSADESSYGTTPGVNEALASAAERAREVLGSPLYKDSKGKYY